MVRRLPVIQSSAPEDEQAAGRPRSHWIAIGAGLAFTLWIPLAMLLMALGRALAGAWVDLDDPTALERFQAAASPAARGVVALSLSAPPLIAFLLSGAAAGALVGRFGGSAGTREGAIGAALAAGVAVLVAALARAASWPVLLAALVALAGLGAVAGALGARWGHRRRPSL